MKDVYEILKQKEADLARVSREVESLRTVAPLLQDALDPNQSEKPKLMSRDDLLNIARENDPDLDVTGAAGHVLTSMLGRRRAA